MGDLPGHEFHGNQYAGGGSHTQINDFNKSGGNAHANMREVAAQSHGNAAVAHEEAARTLEHAANGDSYAVAREFDVARRAHAMSEEAQHGTSSIMQHPAMLGVRGVLGPSKEAVEHSQQALTGSRQKQYQDHVNAAAAHFKAAAGLRAGSRK